MFKTLVLSALLSVAVAAPHHSTDVWQLKSYPTATVPLVYQTSEYAQVGSIHQVVPSAVSHQSRTDYHSKPVIKSVVAPVEIVQPVVHEAPAVVYSATPSEAHIVDESAVVVASAVEPEYAQVGSVVQQVPSAVSHQSRTDYHSKPVVKSVVAPFDYVQPIVHQAPALLYSAPNTVQYVGHPNVVYSAQQPALHDGHLYLNAW